MHYVAEKRGKILEIRLEIRLIIMLLEHTRILFPYDMFKTVHGLLIVSECI